MKWFKLDSNFYNDNRVAECLKVLGKDAYIIWTILLGMIAEQWEGEKEKIFIILAAKLKQTSRTYGPKLDQTLTKLGLLFNITFTKIGPNYHIQYPKFLKKQASYFRGACIKNKSLQEDKNRIDKNRRNIKDTSKLDSQILPYINLVKDKEELKPKIMNANAMQEVLDYFNKICNKKLTLTKEREKLIEKKLNEGISQEDLKKAILNFSKDTWEDRHKYCDLIYAIGTIRGINNFEKWFYMKLKEKYVEDYFE